MNYHQSNVFLQDLSNSFHRWFNLSNFHSGVPKNSWWCFSSSFSTFEEWRRISLESWSVLLKIHSSSLCHPLIIVSNCTFLFLTHSEHFRVVFISWSSKGHHFRRFLRSKFSASFSHYSKLMSLRSSPYSSGASFKYSLISSWSLRSLVSKFSQVSSFIF